MSGAPARVPRSAWLAVGAALTAAWAWFGLPTPLALVAGLLVLAGGLAARPRDVRHAAALTAVGAGATVLALRVLLGPAAPAVPPLPNGSGPWTAVVESVGSPRDGAQVARLALSVEPGPVRVAATLPVFPAVRSGDTVEVRGRLRPPPEDDGYGEYLRRTGAAGSLDVRSLAVIAPPAGLSLQPARDAAGDTLRLSLPEPEAGLAAGILIGLRERVDRSLAADFATAGASHVVAISGWNIAIVAGLVGAALRGRPRRLVAVVVGGTILAYVVAAGASPSVLRAAVMAAVVLLARESGRAGRAPAALALAAFAMLAVEPAMIGDAGFRLSVEATAGLLAWANPLGGWIGGLGGGRVPGWLAEGLGISLAAQAATLPDVLVTFGRLSLVAPAVNLAVVPLVPAAMGAGVLAMAGGALVMLGLPGVVATVLGLPAWLLLHVIVGVVRVAAGLPFAAVAIPPEAGVAAAVVAGALVLLAPWLVRAIRGRRSLRRRLHRRPGVGRGPRAGAGPGAGPGARRNPGVHGPTSRAGRAMVGVAALVIALSTLALGDATGRATRIVLLDVGQGDAILVESRSGGRMLVDGGPDPDRLLLELDARIPPWDRRIDLVVLTHPHEDHVAGLVRVLERYRVGRVFEPGMHGPGPGWEAWDAALRHGPPRATLAAGARLRLDEIALTVLWPDGGVPVEPAATGRGINDTSIVLLGEANGRRFLLTGDAEEDVDPALIARGLPAIDVLKVAHHGSATATSAALLAAARPALALISVGADNDYGHPAPSTVERIRAAGARVMRTDLDGSIAVELRADGLRVETSGARRTGATAPQRRTGANAPRTSSTAPRTSSTAPRAIAARAAPTGYDPFHDRPGAPRGRPPAALARSASLVPPPRLRGRRRGRVPRERDRASRDGDRRGRGRGGGPAPRRGQDPGRARGRHPPRRRIGGLARGQRPGRALTAGAGPPGDAPRVGRRHRPSRRCAAGGQGRRLRGQAGRAAPRAHGRTLRVVAAPLPAEGRGTRQALRSRALGRGDVRAGGGARDGPGARGLRRGRDSARGGPPPALVPPRAPGCRPVTMPVIAYYRGGDGYALDHAVVGVARRLEQETGAAPERWRVAGAETSPAQIAERVGTAPMFGGGCVAVVTDPGPLLRSKDAREALERALGLVAPGNALVFIEQGDAGTKRAAMLQGLESAVIKAGGETRAFPAPRAGELAGWLRNLARDRGINLERDASEELARRVGGFVGEGDVDRQRQGTMAAGELDKLALYRQAAAITVEDVRALVPEVIPDSTWAMTDAVADRRVDIAGPLLDRLLETQPLPVVIVVLHRRLRELLIAADHVAAGTRPPDIVKAIGGHPFRAQKLVEQARRWTLPELDAALEGLLELDAMIKGAVGSGSTERQVRLAFTLWVRDCVARAR
jgi:competence protein ComEC